MTFGSLFAGIGGFDLGLDRAGWRCQWQVEIDPFCRKVLEKHWPTVHRWNDVRTWPMPNTVRVDLITAGFPCQDISSAGTKLGLKGSRSGLFYEIQRIVCRLRPKYLVLENVAAILHRGLGDVLQTLAAIGFDAEWQCLPAAAFGAPHYRNRVYIVAYPHRLVGSERIRFFDEDYWKGPVSRKDYQERAAAHQWQMAAAPKPNGVDDGISSGMDRRRALGNAVVPHIAELIGNRLIEFDKQRTGS